MGKKPTWKDQELIDAIPHCLSFNEVARFLKLSKSCNTILRRRANELGLNFSHFKTSGQTPQPIENILVENKTTFSTHRLKLRLIKENYFEHKCYKCGLTEWNGKPVPIELEHINGDHSDNRLENLTILCPNCHAQTNTYRGKNINRKNKQM